MGSRPRKSWGTTAVDPSLRTRDRSWHWDWTSLSHQRPSRPSLPTDEIIAMFLWDQLCRPLVLRHTAYPRNWPRSFPHWRDMPPRSTEDPRHHPRWCRPSNQLWRHQSFHEGPIGWSHGSYHGEVDKWWIAGCKNDAVSRRDMPIDQLMSGTCIYALPIRRCLLWATGRGSDGITTHTSGCKFV